jgi:uncharacterized protein (TIGR03067 family)
MMHTLLLCAALLPAAADQVPADADASDLAKMQGDWRTVSVTENGTKLADDEAQTLFRTVSGNKYSLFRFSKPLTRGTFKIDATKRPKTIDVMPTASKGPAKPILGIYEFNGTSLWICNARPGKPRPTDFEPKQGSGNSRVVWEPEKK